MSVRVLRIMEYIYPDAETMVDDMARWQVQGTRRIRKGFIVRSAVVAPEFVDGDDADSPE